MSERRSVPNQNKSSRSPWLLPSCVENNDENEKQSKSRIYGSGTQISDNIFNRIQSLGLETEVASSDPHSKNRSSANLRNDNSKSYTFTDDDVLNSVTYIASDGEADVDSQESQSITYKPFVRRSQSEYIIPKKVDFGSLFASEDVQNPALSSSASENDEIVLERGSSNYSEWRTPPKLEPLIYPASEEPEHLNDEPDLDFGLDIIQVDSPNNVVEEPVALTKLTDYKLSQSQNEASKATTRQSSGQSSDTSTNLKSVSEQLRLDAYLKRMAEEENEKKKKLENAAQEKSQTQRLRFEDMDIMESEEMNFSPVNVPWKPSKIDSENKDSETSPIHSEVPKKSKTIDLKVKRGVALSKSSRDSNEASATTPDFQRPSSIASTLLSSRSIKSSRRPTTSTSKKLLRSMSFRKGRSQSNVNPTDVRAAAVQHSLSVGFEGDESTRMTFVLKGDLNNAINAVATTSQQHLQVGVFKRHSGDKLRVECRNETDGLMTLSLGFTEQIAMNRKKMTMVEVRPSRKDKGNWSLARITEFYHKLVTQLDVDGYTVVNASTRSIQNGRRLR